MLDWQLINRPLRVSHMFVPKRESHASSVFVVQYWDGNNWVAASYGYAAVMLTIVRGWREDGYRARVRPYTDGMLFAPTYGYRAR